MFRLSPRTRITLALVGVVGSALFAAKILGFLPNETKVQIEGRRQLCESIAMSGLTMLVSTNEADGFETLVQGIVKRTDSLVSGALRDVDGRVIFATNGHIANWKLGPNEESNDRFMFVPLLDGENEWGRLELTFKPIVGFTPQVIWNSNIGKLIVFMSLACFLMFSFFLRRMLKQLDPSSAVPKRVREALDNLAEGLLIVDRNDRILLANNSFADVVKMAPEKLVGHRASQLNWEGSNSSASTIPWRRALSEERPLSNQTMRIKDGNSKLRTFSVNSSPLLGHEGKYRGVMITFDDVTVLEEKNEQLGVAIAEAEQANQAKSDFLANMSHEIRTPMNAIMGFTDVLRRGMESDGQKKLEYLNTIHSSGSHLLELINDILDLSKIESGKIDLEVIPCSPCKIMADVKSVLQVRADQQGIVLDCCTHGLIPEVIQTDPTRLRQILMNLVGNAIKFTENGSVSLECELSDRKDRLKFAVRDTGIGMTEEQLTRIFNPFEQADASVTRRFGGTGLGLSISKRFSEALGGGIHVESEVGEGSVFSVEIDAGNLDDTKMIDPSVVRQQINESHQVENTQLQIQIKPSRILLVDDGETNRQLVRLILSRLGLDVEEAENGQVAVDKAIAERFDLILMDMQMPVMDGYTAVRTLRDRALTVPIIALTANAMQGDQQKCEEAGCDGFLTKPLNMDQLVNVLVEFLGTAKPQSESSKHRIDGLHPGQLDEQSEIIDRPLTSSNSDGGVSSADEPGNVTAHQDETVSSTLPTDDPAFREIVDRFLEGLPEKLEAMCDAWENEDFDELQNLAHWLKGAGGTVGFEVFTEPSKTLERLAKEHKVSEIEHAISVLFDITERIETVGGRF